jgi:hypothetical protein
MRARQARIGLAWLLLATAVACQSGPTVPATGAPSASPTGAPPAFIAESVGPSPSSEAPSSTAAGGRSVAVDASLLDALPSGDGLERTFDPDTSATVAGDPGLATDAAALAIGLYRLSGAPATSPDIAVASVVRLRDPAADDAWFRSWRDSYDGSACAQAGGITRHLETTIAGRTVYVGACAGGAFTYHTRIAGGGIVVSITSVGAERLGETILERLRP